jgi:hypothetical protein
MEDMGNRNLMRSALIALATLSTASLAIPTAQAGTSKTIALDTQMFVERVHIDLNGRTRRILTSPARLSRGDQLVFVVNWRNQGARPLRDLALSIPGTVRIDPDDPSMEVSVDGGTRWGHIGDLWLATPLGGTRRATAEDVTHIRWAVPPTTDGRISYRGTIR